MAELSTGVAFLLGLLGLVSAVMNAAPMWHGADGIAGAILFGSAVVATSIRDRSRGPASSAKPTFIPEDLRAEALDPRTD